MNAAGAQKYFRSITGMDKGTRMKKAVAMMAATGIACLLGSCSKPAPPAPDMVRPAKLFTVGGAAAAFANSFPGSVRAFDEAELSFPVAGTVIELTVKEGQELKAGDLVARLDDRDFQSAVDAAKAQIKLAQTQFDSQDELYKKGVIAKNDLDKAQRDLDVAASKLAQTQKALGDTVLKAPYGGNAAKRYIESGQNVQPKQAVLLLQDITRLKITINMPEQNVASGQRVSLDDAMKKVRAIATFPTLPGRTFPLALHECALTADPDTRTYAATFTMPSPTNASVIPGMTVSVSLDSSAAAGAFSKEVPVAAVFTAPSGTTCVWVVTKDMTVQQRVVALGEMERGSVRVISGLEQGETIVAAGANELTEGIKIKAYNP